MQGRALLPGAAMFEMAASAAATLLLSASAAASPAAMPALLGVAIPTPLPLTASQAAGRILLSVTLDAAFGRMMVQSQPPAASPAAVAARTHLTASTGKITAHQSHPQSDSEVARLSEQRQLPAYAALMPGTPKLEGTAVAAVEQTVCGQEAQYIVHPAVLDNCTQVKILYP